MRREEERTDHQEKSDTKCWCSKTGKTLNTKHIIRCCGKVSRELNARHDTVVNILLDIIVVQRWLMAHEHELEDWKMVRTANDEIAIGTEHWRSEECREKGRVT